MLRLSQGVRRIQRARMYFSFFFDEINWSACEDMSMPSELCLNVNAWICCISGTSLPPIEDLEGRSH